MSMYSGVVCVIDSLWDCFREIVLLFQVYAWRVTGTVLSLRVTNLTEAIGEDGGGREGTGFKYDCSDGKDAMMPLTV
jgi:hypothetical protein